MSVWVCACCCSAQTVSKSYMVNLCPISLQREADESFFQALIAVEEFSRELLFVTPERKIITNSAADVFNNM